MTKKYKISKLRKLDDGLVDRINEALNALAEPNYVQEVVHERTIRHSKTTPQFELKKSLADGCVRVAVYARGGYGYVVKLLVRGMHGMRDLPDYIRDLNKNPQNYFPEPA